MKREQWKYRFQLVAAARYAIRSFYLFFLLLFAPSMAINSRADGSASSGVYCLRLPWLLVAELGFARVTYGGRLN